MDTASRAQWALSVALSRDDLGFTDWNQAAAVLAAVCAMPSSQGLEGRALEQAMELVAERFQRMPERPKLPAVPGEESAEFADLLGYTTVALRHGGLATTYVALTARVCELAGRALTELERTRLTRIVRSVLVTKEVDRYLGAVRESPEGLPDDPDQALGMLEVEAVSQLGGIQPDQVYKGSRIAFVGELIHGVMHAFAVRQVLRLVPEVAPVAIKRLGEQVVAQRKLVETRGTQQFDEELEGPSTLDFLEVLGQGFDDPEKLQFACCARALWEAHGRPEEWEPLITRTLAALE